MTLKTTVMKHMTILSLCPLTDLSWLKLHGQLYIDAREEMLASDWFSVVDLLQRTVVG